MSGRPPTGASGGPDAAFPTGRGRLARELLKLRCLQLDTAPLEEIIAYDLAASAAAEAQLHAGAAAVGDAVPPLPPPERLLLSWYLSGRSPFCRAALTALASQLAHSAGRTAVVALTPEQPEAARRTRAELALPFPVVHDDGGIAEELGVRYEAPATFVELLGLAGGTRIPVPATFLIEAGRIRARFVHPDSRYRGEPAAFLRT